MAIEGDPRMDALLTRQNDLLNELDRVETQIDNLLGATVLRECVDIEGIEDK